MSDNQNDICVAAPGTEAAKCQMDEFARKVGAVGDTAKEAGQSDKGGKQSKGFVLGIVAAVFAAVATLVVVIVAPVVIVLFSYKAMYNIIMNRS